MTDIDESTKQQSPHRQEVSRPSGGCCCCGTGCGRALLFLSGVGGLACSIYTVLSCKFFALTSGVQERDDLPFPPGARSIGVFSYASDLSTSDQSTCISYEEQFWKSPLNSYFKVAQFAAIVAPCLGFLALWVNVVEMIRSYFSGSFIVPVVLYLFACLVQALTFMVFGETHDCFGEDGYCELKEASYVSVASVVLYYFCSVLLCFLPRPDPRNKKSSPPTAPTSIAESPIRTSDSAESDEESLMYARSDLASPGNKVATETQPDFEDAMPSSPSSQQVNDAPNTVC